jgi:ATP-dependent DNA ligase
VIDGEAIVCDDDGLSVFDLIRNYRRSNSATALRLRSEFDDQDMRNQPLEKRKTALKMLLAKSAYIKRPSTVDAMPAISSHSRARRRHSSAWSLTRS